MINKIFSKRENIKFSRFSFENCKTKKGNLALTQILILLISTIAVSWLIGMSLPSVSGGADDPDRTGNTPSAASTPAEKPAAQAPPKDATNTTQEEGGGIMGLLTGSQKGFWGNAVQGAMWAMTVYGLVKWVGGMFSDNTAGVNAAATALAAGVFVGKAVYGWKLSKGMAASKAANWGIGVGLAVAVVVFILMYKKQSSEIITYECHAWDAPVGGQNCEKCNQQGILTCSEYQCRSLGQACQLLNPGTTDEKCTWVNRRDVEQPIIEPWVDALLPDYKYNPDKTISPPDRGVKIVNTKSDKGCVPAFTPVSFGVTVNEPAKCKVDFIRRNTFDEMQFYFGGSSLFKYNHSQIMSLPGPTAETNGTPILQNNGEFEMYTRCMDANGNTNVATFVFKYCVDDGPDTTPPLIVTTDLINGMPIAYNQTSVNLNVYINEPAICKWSFRDQDYDKMENDMICSTSVYEMNAQMLYRCKTTLNGMKNMVTNDFYFRCKDKPIGAEEVDRNVNTQSYKFSLIGTRPLVIDDVGPNETIKDSTDVVKVKLTAKTSAGYNQGEANCYFSETGETDSYILFAKTDSHEHEQELYLTEGNYEYFIKCVDLGGNSDEDKVAFSIETDLSSPVVTRTYKEESNLKVVTNEKAECVYSKDSCNYLFEDGVKLSSSNDGKEHFTLWDTKTSFFVKCQDEYKNQPLPNQCSIVVRPFDIDFN